jgi:hypothetical protein
MGNGLAKNKTKQQLEPIIVHGCYEPKCAVNETAEKLQYSAVLAAHAADERDRAAAEAYQLRRAQHEEKTRLITEHIARARLEPLIMPATVAMPVWNALFEVEV